MIDDVRRRLGPWLLLGLVLSTGTAVRAQNNEDPFEEGSTEGRMLGIRQGRVEGRAQALYDSFLEGFRQGLREARAASSAESLAGDARAAGRAKGLEAGREAGEAAGAAAALEAWILGPSPRPPAETPEPPPAPALSDEPPCPAARTARIGLVRGLTVELELGGLENRPSPVHVDEFDIGYPSEETLRQRARAAGASAEAIRDWVRDYKFAFQSAWHDAFQTERAGTPLGDREELRTVGLEEGRREGERRMACEAAPRERDSGHAAGWAEGWRAGYRDGWSEADERHARRAVVVLRRARLVDASGDGLLEPGEELLLDTTLLNAGSEEAVRASGSWEVLRGQEAEGWFEGGLAPRESHEVRLSLGKVPADAPPGTSIVVRVRGLGSEPQTLSERLGRPASIDEVQAALTSRAGRVYGRLDVTVASASAASERAALELVTEGPVEPVGRVPGGRETVVSVETPASLPDALGQSSTGVLVLRTAEGVPWHAARWSAPFGLAEAVRFASAREPVAGAADKLVAALAAAWPGEGPGGEPAEQLPAAWREFAELRAGLEAEERSRLDRLVTERLLETVERSDAPRRLRKLARSTLEG